MTVIMLTTLLLTAGATLMVALALGLVALRAQPSRIRIEAVARAWRAMPTGKAVAVIAALIGLPVLSAINISMTNDVPAEDIASRVTRADAATSSADHALDDLKTYANSIAPPQQSFAPETQPPQQALDDVDTMISKLAARLEKQPDDVKGWRMLGWSYEHTGKSAEAAAAYKRALALEPQNTEITAALAALQSRSSN